MGKKAERLVGYARVSLEKQSDNGISLEAQEEKLRGYCTLYGHTLVKIIRDEGQSGKSLDRPGLQQALGMLERGEADGLVVAKLDRLTRSVRDIGKLVETAFKTASLHSVAEQVNTRTSAGRLVLNILSSVSQWEREAISERTSTALRHMQSQGRYIGGARPFGFTVEDGKLVPLPAEQKAIKRARELAPTLSLRAVARQLQNEGLTPRQLHPQSLSRALRARSQAAA